MRNGGSFSRTEENRLGALTERPDLGNVIIDTIKDNGGNNMEVKSNILGAIAWIYSMKFKRSLPSLGNDCYNVPGTGRPGYLHPSMFQNLLDENGFRMLDDIEWMARGDILTVQTVPEEFDCGAFDVILAGMYLTEFLDENNTTTYNIFGQGDINVRGDPDNNRFGEFEWNEWKIDTLYDGFDLRSWRRD